MRFEPKTPREGINVSQRNPFREAVVLTAALGVLLIVAVFVIAKSVDWAVRLVPHKTEAQAFEALPRSLDALGFEGKPGPRQDQVADLLDRLASHWPDSPYTFRLLEIWGAEPNALALPGGLILVTTGLLNRVDSENELALVLGHELGHFRHRHHLRHLGRGLVYGLLLSAITGSGVGLDHASFGSDLTARSFDRDAELTADRFGLRLVAAEYGHVAGSQDFFRGMLEKDPSSPIGEYLATHPASQDRIEAIEAYAREQGWSLEGELRPF